MKRNAKAMWFLLALIVLSCFSTAFAQSPAYYTVSGEVRDEFGKLTAGVQVCAFPDISDPNRNIYCGQSNENGKFIIRLPKPGKYGLFYDKAADGYMSQFRPFYRHASAKIPEVNLDDTSPNAIAAVTLSPKNGVITGKAIDAQTNLPIEALRILMCHADRPQVCFPTNAKNSDGTFRVWASPVPFTLKITADGYEVWSGAAGTNEPIYLPTGAAMELHVYLKRRAESADVALSEAEKQVGVHLPAPAPLSPKHEVEFNHYPRATKLEWEPVEGAVSYTVEVDACQGGISRKSGCVNPQPFTMPSNPPTTGIVSTSYEFNFVGAQPGRWRVWAVDKDGRAGFKSSWRTFFYLR